MEAVVDEALKNFVTDVMSSDRPSSELSLKIFLIFKTVVGNLSQENEETVLKSVNSYLMTMSDVKNQIQQSESSEKCVLLLRGQILIRLLFIWVTRDCLKKDLENTPGGDNVIDDIVKICEMFCIRTDPIQLNSFLSDTVLKMYLDYIPDILMNLFDELLLPIPKDLAKAVGDHNAPFSPSPNKSKEDEDDNGTKVEKKRRNSRDSQQPRKLIMSPIKNCDSNSKQNMNRFGKRPGRQILVAARSSTSDLNLGKKKTVVNRNRKEKSLETSSSNFSRKFEIRSYSFDQIGANLRQAAVQLEKDITSKENGGVRRCLFGESFVKTKKPPGYTTPRKRSAAAMTASVADTPPMETAKLGRIAPSTPLSKLKENQENLIFESPKQHHFSKPDALPFKVMTTPLRQLQQCTTQSPAPPGTILVPQSPDDAKVGIAARSFYNPKQNQLPQSVISAKKNINSSQRRTMSSYDLGGNGPSRNPNQNDSTHFLFAELLTMSPTTGYTESSITIGNSHGYFPPAEIDFSPCRRRPSAAIDSLSPSIKVQNSSQRNHHHPHMQSAIPSSPVIESRSSSRRLFIHQQRPDHAQSSPFSVAAGFVCE